MNKKIGNLAKINKKGQASDAVVWIVATAIIATILLISISISIDLGGNKTFNQDTEFDLFAKKSLTSYLLTQGQSGDIIFEELKEENNFNDFNKNLAIGIFKGFYERDYLYGKVWLGFNSEGGWNWNIPGNNPFGEKPLIETEGGVGMKVGSLPLLEMIHLEESQGKNNWIELILSRN